MPQFVTSSREETQALARLLAPFLRPGDTLLMRADMGMGKSEFARGIAKGLGINGAVPSPTFTIMNVYEGGRLPFYHFDLYRLEDEDEFEQMGFSEFICGEGVSLIEWPQNAESYMPERALNVYISAGDGECGRVIKLEGVGGFELPPACDLEGKL
ncbi:MAG: tRNA (adenosine(37)-N6)-threonylcarbamoyltransferase complex ATPase subunit type 1 TsaE [Eubacteriales bacterium]|nr:tRNA (adenosine(37)-N6)-threonylcarbamoyltransferase complex ATPase subunit type 1 TsaE [Eubacteriales bacterium]MDD3880883.1 tRNA (adenosine(37)-N6)-threonylcarbamoyltransferase complex ATPase subunit type 1 TsaE [Eubacteriales bacterium]MDD4511750.1 tRNA (adenosine(37)-N6)-threonylcarbamoyltransferase complex ATPase subunit type 1 TsaE [Eubacteriales bacterium]